MTAGNQPPRLLYFCDFPPSNLRGGAILLSRLLGGWPADRLELWVGSEYAKRSPPDGRVSGVERILPVTSGRGRWGLGRLKTFCDWMMIPSYGLLAAFATRLHGHEALVTVAHGHLFVAATLCSTLTGLPLVVIVHDDWVAEHERQGGVLGRLARPILSGVLRQASMVFAVSLNMQQLLRHRHHVESVLQMPATEYVNEMPRESDGTLTVAYCGTWTGAVADTLALLVDVIKSQALSSRGVPDWRLELYTPLGLSEVRRLGLDHQRIVVRGWLSQRDLQVALTGADVLFLPFSFDPNESWATSTAFPTKAADYLAAKRPILVVGPPESSVVAYARQEGMAEIVDSPSCDLIADALAGLWHSPGRCAELNLRAEKTFAKNHDIAHQRREFVRRLESLNQRSASR